MKGGVGGRTENEEETPTIASVEESERWGLFRSIKRGGEGSSAHQSILTPFAPFSCSPLGALCLFAYGIYFFGSSLAHL